MSIHLVAVEVIANTFIALLGLCVDVTQKKPMKYFAINQYNICVPG